MKKVILSLGLLAAVTSVANAQASFGVKAGGSYTGLTGDGSDGSESKLGFHGGVFANIGFGDALSVQPELLFSMKGAQDKENSDLKLNMNYIDIPVMLQYNADGLLFEAGPQLGVLMSAKAAFDGAEIDVKENLNTIDFGYAVGLGYKLESGPQIGLRYNGGITNNIKEGDATQRNSAFQLYVGYSFGGK